MANERVQRGSGLWLERNISIAQLAERVAHAYPSKGEGKQAVFRDGINIHAVVGFVAEALGYQEGQWDAK